MTAQELIDLLSALVREQRLDPNEELSMALDVGDDAIVADIDFIDEKNQLICCSVWCTSESTFALCENEQEEA